MERLDYRINEGGIERWISYEKVMTILTFLYPAIAQEIEQKMRWDDKPHEYMWAGKRIKIEYKGPDPRGVFRVERAIGSLFLLALLFFGVGCNGVKRLAGADDRKNPKPQFYIVAGCMDNNETGRPTFPTFLPASHIDLLKRVRAACHANDCQIDGNTWLAVGADCGHGHGFVGDEYYVGRSY